MDFNELSDNGYKSAFEETSTGYHEQLVTIKELANFRNK